MRLKRARTAARSLADLLIARGINGELVEHKELLIEHLQNGTYYQKTVVVDQAIEAIESAYRKTYAELHEKRSTMYREAIDRIKGLPDWVVLDTEVQEDLLEPLAKRYCDLNKEKGEHFKLPEAKTICNACLATIPEMESDIAAAQSLMQGVMQKIQALLKPDEKVERVRISEIINTLQGLSTREEVEEALEQLREALIERIDAGVKIILE